MLQAAIFSEENAINNNDNVYACPKAWYCRRRRRAVGCYSGTPRRAAIYVARGNQRDGPARSRQITDASNRRTSRHASNNWEDGRFLFFPSIPTRVPNTVRQ